MLVYAIAFLAGVCSLQLMPVLPPVASLVATPLAVLLFRWPATRWLAVLVLGFCWALLRATLVLDVQLDPVHEGQTLLVEGTVEGAPREYSRHYRRFLLRVARLDTGDGWQPFEARVRLGVYGDFLQPASGERWQLAVRLKRPHGFANPGGFDYERWLFQNRIRATGYVRDDERNRRLGVAEAGGIAALRNRLQASLAAGLPDMEFAGIILAVTTGLRDLMTDAQWQVFRSTGTAHLVAISGLHISLVAGLVFMLVRRAWLLSAGLALLLPAGRVAAVAAMSAALLYSQLAGFGIPTQRALVMVCAGMLGLMLGRTMDLSRAMGLAMFATLLFDPQSVLSAGWWLSFWAVGVIAWLATGREGRQSPWKKWLGMHCVLAVGMAPLLLVFFGQASLSAPAGNVVAVPWVSLLVVPLALIGVLVFSLHEPAGMALLGLAAELVGWLWPWLEFLAASPFASAGRFSPPAWTLLPAMAGCALLFLPRGVPGRLAGVPLLLPLVLYRPAVPGPGGFTMMQLDVGQGLATVVETQGHVLVYDAGARFSDRFDAGGAVVVPYLEHRGVESIDTLVVSHGDNDHIGGVDSLIEAFPVRRVIAGIPERLSPGPAVKCRSGRGWVWDGVRFEVLYPPPGDVRTGNNASCVLKIESAFGHSVLLTGDIEAVAERALLSGDAKALRADVLVAPHHGSLTSSIPAFARAVSPAVTIFPAGYRNRFGFPKAGVVSRYRDVGSRLFHTGHDGAVSVVSTADGLGIRRYRERVRHYWNEPPLAVWLPP